MIDQNISADQVTLPGLGQTEVLCSAVLMAGDRFEESVAMVETIRTFLNDRFSFWEILVVVPHRLRHASPSAFQRISLISGTRLLVVRNDIERNRIIALAAAESIGDFVIFVADEEFEALNLPEIWEAGEKSGRSVLLSGRRVGRLDRVAASLLSAVVGFRADPEMLRSCAHFRERLSWLLQRTDSNLAFRFNSVWSGGDDNILLKVNTKAFRTPTRRTLLQRLLLTADLVGHAAPRLLRFMAVASLLGLLGALGFSIYAILLLVIGFDLVEGWFSTALAISASTAFICAALGCVSLGVARLLERQKERAPDDVLQQISNAGRLDDFAMLNVVSHHS